MYIYIYIYIHIHTYIHIHIYIYIYISKSCTPALGCAKPPAAPLPAAPPTYI